MSNSLVTINNMREANLALQPYVPLVAQLTGKDTTLKRIQPLMQMLGNPQDKLQAIHIAGTSGKTSTAYYLSALIGATGKKVGLTVSPHVDSVTERVQINNQPINDDLFCNELSQFLEIVQQASEKPSYFELIYAFSLWVFVRQKVDYAVIETGMGGLYDATNVIIRPDKICVITDIGFDHTRILGNTLTEIATQKIGIVHDHNVVFTYIQADEIMQTFQNWTTAHHALLTTITQTEERQQSGLDFSGIAKYQERNWLLAYKVYQYLVERDSIENLTSEVLMKTLQTAIPGRMDIKQLHGKTLIMDGAHNFQKMTAFEESFKELYPNIKPVVIIALKHDKDYQEVADLLSSFAERVIVTTFSSSQDLPVKSMEARILAEAFGNRLPVQVINDPILAVRTFLNGPESIGVVTGSFYLLSQIRNNIDQL